MSRIRFRPLSEKQLRPIREARAFLAELTGRERNEADEPASPEFGFAHAIHVMGLRDLVEGNGIIEAPVSIRVMESAGAEKGAYYDLTASEHAPELMQMAAGDNGYGALLERGIATAHRWADAHGREADLRMLRVPALYTEALLLRTSKQEEEIAIVIRTFQEGIDMLRPMPLSELLDKLKAPARFILDRDGGRQIA